MKFLSRISSYFFFLATLFLLVFIPLYPKKPLIDVVNTWVYIRAEDFIVFFVLFVWILFLLKKKISFKTPLTVPILIFWLTGLAATFHGILIIFPQISNVFPSIAFLNFLRRIEYVGLFFIGFESVKNKKYIPFIAGILVVTAMIVIAYGFGQKYLEFPAYLTMNEEFAKGIPIKLSFMSRISSTFGGHYDLAAYLVLVLPIMVSLLFSVRSKILKLLLFCTSLAGVGALYLTVSRISFVSLLAALCVVIYLQKRKLFIGLIPLLLVSFVLFVHFAPTLVNRYQKTIQEADVMVNTEKNIVVGHPKKVLSDYLQNKIIRDTKYNPASESAYIDYTKLPQEILVVESETKSTGEDLPEGSAYINLPLSPNAERPRSYLFIDKNSDEVLLIHGNFVIKKALAYDLSFTTRFQGGWPNAITAFKRNLLVGSGYGSATLAVDNNYLRMLAETGIAGTAAFIAILLAIGIYIRSIYPYIPDRFLKSLVVGYTGGMIGLCINALLIDVFEASKVAFYFWLLTGVILGILMQYKTKDIHLAGAGMKLLKSPFFAVLGLFALTIVVYSGTLNNYFVADDYTWLRNAAENNIGIENFYVQGTNLVFKFLYSFFWLNETIYHMVAILLHFIASVLVLAVSRRIFRRNELAVLAAIIFMFLSGFSEALFWISSLGLLLQAVCTLASLFAYILWTEKRKTIYLVFSIFLLFIGLSFHELGIVTPFILLLYDVLFVPSKENGFRAKLKLYALFVSPVLIYLLVGFLRGTVSFSPFTIVANTIGYWFLSITGSFFLPMFKTVRVAMQKQVLISTALLLMVFFLIGYLLYRFAGKIQKKELKILLFGFLFFFIGIIPFLCFETIYSRYLYLAGFGSAIILVFLADKAYAYLKPNGKLIASLSGILIISIFLMFQVIELNKSQTDWDAAGSKIKNFLSSIDGSYEEYWKSEPMTFYFINIPHAYGVAQVFSSGLDDALWFSLKNPNIRIEEVSSLEEAYRKVKEPFNDKIFLFDDSGKVIQKLKPVSPTPVLDTI
jgi:hypothetical protein